MVLLKPAARLRDSARSALRGGSIVPDGMHASYGRGRWRAKHARRLCGFVRRAASLLVQSGCGGPERPRTLRAWMWLRAVRTGRRACERLGFTRFRERFASPLGGQNARPTPKTHGPEAHATRQGAATISHARTPMLPARAMGVSQKRGGPRQPCGRGSRERLGCRSRPTRRARRYQPSPACAAIGLTRFRKSASGPVVSEPAPSVTGPEGEVFSA